MPIETKQAVLHERRVLQIAMDVPTTTAATRTLSKKRLAASVCGMLILAGICTPSMQAAPPKQGKAPSWNEIARTFKPEGDKTGHAKQRIDLLNRLISQFPDEREKVISARLELGRLHEESKDFEQAAGNFRDALAGIPEKDARRVGG